MGKMWEKVKLAVKPIAEGIEPELEKNSDKLGATIKASLDKNGDGQLSIDDFAFLIKQTLDTNGNGKFDFWEIISALFLIRKWLKKIKG